MQIKMDVTLSTYNSERTLENCLDAIEQEIPVNNVIIVDGGSDDRTLEIIKNHSLKTKIILFVRPDLNLGQSRAFSFQKVTTEYFAQLDSDIVLKKGWYQEMVKTLREDIGVIEGGRINHFSICSRYGNEMDRGLFGQNIIRAEAVKDISIKDLNVLVNEDNLTRYLIQKKGYHWIKNGCLLADHYSNPERYKDSKLWIYRLNVSRKTIIASGLADKKTKRYKKLLLMFLDLWYKPLKLWVLLTRKCIYYYIGWLKKIN